MAQTEEHEGGFWDMLVGDDKNYQDGSAEDEAKRNEVLGQLAQQEAELAQLLPLAHQLRMQRHQLHETYCEKIDELEARILRAHVVPFDDGFVSHLQRHAPKPSTRPAPMPRPISVAAEQPEDEHSHLLNDPSLPAWLPEVLAQHPLKPGERVIGYRRVDDTPEREMGLFGYHEEEAPVSNRGTDVHDHEKGSRAWPGVAEVTYADKDEFGNLVPNDLWYTDASKIPACPPVKTLEPRWLDRVGKPGYNLYKYTH